MTEKQNDEQTSISWTEHYERAKIEKPLLAKLTDSIWFKGIPSDGTITEAQGSEQFRQIVAREKVRFLELCKKDVALNQTQTEVLKEVLGKTIAGFGIKNSYLPGSSLIAEKHPDLLLIAATYVNSL